jgi:DNA-binding NarL/FixJ family response regulator
MKPPCVIIVDDHPMLRPGIAQIVGVLNPLRVEFPKVAVPMPSTLPESQFGARALRGGAVGQLNKGCSQAVLLPVISNRSGHSRPIHEHLQRAATRRTRHREPGRRVSVAVRPQRVAFWARRIERRRTPCLCPQTRKPC